MTASTYPFEWEGLPEASPTTKAAVKAHLAYEASDETDDVFIDSIVLAVDDLVRGLPTAERSVGAEEWVDRTKTGATMLAARLVKRRNSPEGVAAFNEAGAVYVQRNDPDVAALLEIGRSARPQVG